MLDAADLGSLYTAQQESLDRKRVLALAREVYPGAERELEELLRRIDAGEAITT